MHGRLIAPSHGIHAGQRSRWAYHLSQQADTYRSYCSSYCSGLTTLSIGMELSGVNCTTEPGRGAWITMPSPA